MTRFAWTRTVAMGLAVTMAAATGCRDTDDDDSEGGGADAAPGDDLSIYQVRTGAVAVGDGVTLRGVVVTGIDARGNATGDFWVAEPDEHPSHGRAYGGILVFGADVADVANIAVGDLIDIEGGELDEFAFNCDDCEAPLDTLSEIKPAAGGSLAIARVGTADAPAPVVVSAPGLGSDQVEADKWESVAITVENVAALSNPREISGDSTRLDFGLTGPIAVQSSMGPIPDVARDDCFASVTGIGNYFFGFKILPRTDADLVVAGDASTCAYETEAGACDDGDDNDFDGFVDCEDFSCVESNPGVCTIAIADVQTGTIAENSVVSIGSAVVTAASANGQHVWIQTEGTTSDYTGIHVFRGTTPPDLDPRIVVGARIDLIGQVTEFETPFDSPVSSETEIEVDADASDLAFVSGGANVAARTGLTAAELADPAAGEPYEGLLVELTNVAVVTMDAGFGEFTIGEMGADLHVDDLLFNYPLPAKDLCFRTLRGVVAESFGNRKIMPRGADDMVPGGVCD